MSLTNTWDTFGLYRSYDGHVDVSVILDAILDLHNHPRFHDTHYVINDFSNITDYEINIDDVQAITKLNYMSSNTKGSLRVAVITADEPAQTALAEIYCLLMEQCTYQCKAFISRSEAKKWATTDCTVALS